MQPIQFYAVGEPKGQPRPRAFARKMGNQVIARVYEGGTAEGWKSQIAVAAKEHLPAAPIEFPVTLHLEFYFPRPRSHYRTGKRANELRDDFPGYHTKAPDADNLAKAVMDALSVLRMWRDDAQVAHLIVRKLYDDGRGPGCIISIKEA